MPQPRLNRRRQREQVYIGYTARHPPSTVFRAAEAEL